MTNFDTPKTPRNFVEAMLRSSLEADQLVAENINDRWLREAHTHTAVNGLVAAMAMEALRRFSPEAADYTASNLSRILTAGDVAGPAYRFATGCNLAPEQWLAEFSERAAKRREAGQ